MTTIDPIRVQPVIAHGTKYWAVVARSEPEFHHMLFSTAVEAHQAAMLLHQAQCAKASALQARETLRLAEHSYRELLADARCLDDVLSPLAFVPNPNA